MAKKKRKINYINSSVRKDGNTNYYGKKGKPTKDPTEIKEIKKEIEIGQQKGIKYFSPITKKQVTKEDYKKDKSQIMHNSDFGKEKMTSEQLESKKIEIKQKREEEIEEKKPHTFREKFEMGANFLEQQKITTGEIVREPDIRKQFGLRLGIGAAVIGGAATVGIAATVTSLSSLAGGVAGVDAIATWAAVDNFASSIPFQMNEVINGVSEGSISPDEALNLMEQADNQLNKAVSWVNESTRKNPLLWVARKRYMSVVDNARNQVELKRIRIENQILNTELEGGSE